MLSSPTLGAASRAEQGVRCNWGRHNRTYEKPRGGYMKASRLAQPSGAVLVEYHLVFEEPQGWFGGSNLLRSKLPLVCQDGVRKFRRRMATLLVSENSRSISER